MGRKWFQRSRWGAIINLCVKGKSQSRSWVGQLSTLHGLHREEIILLTGGSHPFSALVHKRQIPQECDRRAQD